MTAARSMWTGQHWASNSGLSSGRALWFSGCFILYQNITPPNSRSLWTGSTEPVTENWAAKKLCGFVAAMFWTEILLRHHPAWNSPLSPNFQFENWKVLQWLWNKIIALILASNDEFAGPYHPSNLSSPPCLPLHRCDWPQRWTGFTSMKIPVTW